MLALGLQMVSDQARTYFLIKSFNNSVFVLTLSHRDRVKRWLSQTPKNVRSLVFDLDLGKLFTKTLGRGVRDKLVRANQTNLSKLFLLLKKVFGVSQLPIHCYQVSSCHYWLLQKILQKVKILLQITWGCWSWLTLGLQRRPTPGTPSRRPATHPTMLVS